jgi:hypothetical protein
MESAKEVVRALVQGDRKEPVPNTTSTPRSQYDGGIETLENSSVGEPMLRTRSSS